MRIFGIYRPRLRTYFRNWFKPFFVLSVLCASLVAFQNFGFVSQNEYPKDSILNSAQKSVVFDTISEAKAFETSEGPFTIIKGNNGQSMEVDYLNNLDVSGKDCIKMAQMASQTGQHLKLVGIPVGPDPKGIMMFQRILDCHLEPQTTKTAEN